MKNKSVVLTLALLTGASHALAQGTAFTYQGRLDDGGSPANGVYDIRASAWNAPTAGTMLSASVTNPAVAVSNGLFTIVIDFGPTVFTGGSNWLQMGVRTNGAAVDFTALSPRQQLTPAPYAIYSEGANAAGLTGTVPSASLSGGYGAAVSLTNPVNAFAGNGSGLTGVNAATLGGLMASNFWQLGGNTTPPGSQVLGTLSNQPLDLYANGVRALRLILRTDATGMYSNAPNVIGGSQVNLVRTGVVGGTVGGGGGYDTNAVTYPNQVNANFGAISGGASNDVTSLGVFSFIGGGQGNVANQGYAVLGGGLQNIASNAFTVVGGGFQNSAGGAGSTVGGGALNASTFIYTTVGGGLYNTASGTNAGYSTVSGGETNTATGDYSTIGGGYGNVVSGAGSVIAGGGYDGYFFNGNIIQDSGATIGGGSMNHIYPGGYLGFIGGGGGNYMTGGNATIAGGYENYAAAQSAAIGGGVNNQASGIGSFIGGGGDDGVTYGYGNIVQANAAAIVGGIDNVIPLGARYAFIGGGYYNTNSGKYATVGGGVLNTASGLGSFVGGGSNNFATGRSAVVGGGGDDGTSYFSFTGNVANGAGAVVGGGVANQAYGRDSSVGGGMGNLAGGPGSTVPGGSGNIADGNCSFAAGSGAESFNNGCFIWADAASGLAFLSTADNQFSARATGGVRFVTAVDVSGTPSAGVKLGPGDTAWSTISDRNAKKNFQPVDTVGVLNKLAAIPIEQWNYKWEGNSDTPNLGPMAQDFKAAFYPGRDDKSISTLEFDGVELAAIQGLNQKLEAQLKQQRAENAALKKRLERLEEIVFEQERPERSAP